MSTKFCVSGSLDRDAGEKRNLKGRKYVHVYQKVSVHPERHSTAK